MFNSDDGNLCYAFFLTSNNEVWLSSQSPSVPWRICMQKILLSQLSSSSSRSSCIGVRCLTGKEIEESLTGHWTPVPRPCQPANSLSLSLLSSSLFLWQWDSLSSVTLNNKISLWFMEPKKGKWNRYLVDWKNYFKNVV